MYTWHCPCAHKQKRQHFHESNFQVWKYLKFTLKISDKLKNQFCFYRFKAMPNILRKVQQVFSQFQRINLQFGLFILFVLNFLPSFILLPKKQIDLYFSYARVVCSVKCSRGCWIRRMVSGCSQKNPNCVEKSRAVDAIYTFTLLLQVGMLYQGAGKMSLFATQKSELPKNDFWKQLDDSYLQTLCHRKQMISLSTKGGERIPLF